MANRMLPALAADPGLARYLADIRRFPILDAREEQALARRCHDSGDCVAANKLVTSHLRLVAKIAMAYRGYGLPIAEIISEGALGLLRAVRRFDADRGFRLATYATFWIRAAIQDYILRSWSLVKVATTASQRRLFFNLRKTKARIAALDDDLRASQVVQIARRLGVSEKDVNEMNPRLHGDVSLNVSPNREGEGEWQDLLADESESQEAVLLEQDERRNRAAALQEALSALAPRERRIFVARRLADDPITLDRLSIEFRVSRERVRQIERRVFEKVQAAAKKKPRRARGAACDLGCPGGSARADFRQGRALRHLVGIDANSTQGDAAIQRIEGASFGPKSCFLGQRVSWGIAPAPRRRIPSSARAPASR